MPPAGRRPSLSVAIITRDEEANIRRTLESVRWAEEIVVVDSGSTDRTCDIAREFGAKVFVEPWKGFAAQKNSALDKCTSDWILSLDADEEVSAELREDIATLFGLMETDPTFEYDEGDKYDRPSWDRFYPIAPGDAFELPRKNYFLGRWIQHGGFYPDHKMRLFKRGFGRFGTRAVHETVELKADREGRLPSPLLHHAYPTLSSYIEHMNRYSSLGAEMVVEKRRHVGFSFLNIVIRPWATFIYNYFFHLGFLDGKEGLLLHLYHAVYVSWKYAKAWEMSRTPSSVGRQ